MPKSRSKVKRFKQESAHSKQTHTHTHGRFQTYYLPYYAVDNKSATNLTGGASIICSFRCRSAQLRAGQTDRRPTAISCEYDGQHDLSHAQTGLTLNVPRQAGYVRGSMSDAKLDLSVVTACRQRHNDAWHRSDNSQHCACLLHGKYNFTY